MMESSTYDKKVSGKFSDNLVRNIKEGKFIHMAKFGADFSYAYIKARYLSLLNRRFKFRGKEYKYLYYYSSWRDERCVEVPIVWNLLNNSRALERKLDILEIGNVLSYYYKFSHDVVDKYEVGDGVINEDIVTFNPNKRYDLIISVSTIEHVGWDEAPRVEGKLTKALENIKALLKPEGFAVITMPVGYNKEFDALYSSGRITFDRAYYLKRVKRSDWVESDWNETKDSRFDYPYKFANALIIGIIGNYDWI